MSPLNKLHMTSYWYSVTIVSICITLQKWLHIQKNCKLFNLYIVAPLTEIMSEIRRHLWCKNWDDRGQLVVQSLMAWSVVLTGVGARQTNKLKQHILHYATASYSKNGAATYCCTRQLMVQSHQYRGGTLLHWMPTGSRQNLIQVAQATVNCFNCLTIAVLS